jgi:protein-disulfide isomerase
MRPRTPLAIVALATLAAACAAREKPAQAASPAAVPRAAGPAPSASDPAAVLPGVDLTGLTPEQARMVAAFALEEFCYCGCPHTLSGCLRSHPGCRHAPRMARLAVRYARSGASRAELTRLVDAYYASFDRRAKLDVKGWGPPLGNPDAPVTIVEFSDFTCPYCRQLRPALEAFVNARVDRVKLLYKPFPIESHPNAREAAEAGEWAREHGAFWPMHDRLFEGSHTISELADDARAVGGDPADLRDAVESARYRGRIEASQAEARAAGLRGTPTLFVNGRIQADMSDDGLEQALEDEEEWQKNAGWVRD